MLADRSYRIPTFNDRYWRDQGRKDLKPEEGYNLEAGMKLDLVRKRHKWTVDASTYWMLIDNWIAWLPDHFLSDRDGDGIPEPVYDWRPFNLKTVEASGVELMVRYDLTINGFSLGAHAQYAYTRAVVKQSDRDDDPSLGKQLPYTPAQRYTLGLNGTKKGYFVNLTNYYIGKRTGQDVIGDIYPGYSLVNLVLGKNFHIKNSHLLSGSFTVKNLFNTQYENVYRRAMPGRNYLISIKYFLTTKSK
jgi:iron complex outermembrane receptor protein